MAEQVIARSAARAQGLKRYFTGKVCKRGHCAERYVSNLECVTCKYDKDVDRQWHKQNPERKRELGRLDYQRHKETRKVSRARRAAENPDYFKDRWQAIPIEARKARKRTWYLKNREAAVKYTAEWAARNPEQHKLLAAAVTRRRRARMLNSPGTHTAADLAAILKAQKHLCAYCRTDLRKTKKHVDHIHPLSLGGSNDKANLQYLCQPCNLSKGAKHPIAFAQELGRLL